MIIFLLILLFIAAFKLKFAGNGFYSDSYISREQTLCLNGIFIAYILLSHTFAIKSGSGILSDSFNYIRIYLGQFPVVPILFFSGFGIMESIKKKKDYVKEFPKRRLLDFYVKFFVLSIPYVLLNLYTQKYNLRTVLFSFTGFVEIGNGGWYIGVTLAVYIFIILCFNIFKNKHILAVGAVTVLTALMLLVEMKLGLPSYYYSTMIFMPLGMCFSLIKDKFDAIVMKNNLIWSLGFVLSVALSIGFNILADLSFVFYPVWCFFGLVALLLFSMKIKLSNAVLLWLGQTIFLNFILQGLPQELFALLPLGDISYYMLVFISTLIIVYIANYLIKPVERLFKS